MTGNKNPKTENLLQRPPVVVVMGHVDHGKTTLLDYIRKLSYRTRAASDGGEPRSVAEREAGGITQSIGAYEIEVRQKDEPKSRESEADRRIPQQKPRDDFASRVRKITFIDTPGHEAFTKMRSRGANIADLAILVVAADEGLKPQTKESVKILEETKTPFVVAITKIDKNNADIERVKNDLTANNVLLEGYGGQVSYQPVSATTGEGINELLDLILLAAELEHLTYDKNAVASGYILEAKLDRQRGLEASVIVKNGVIKSGEFISTKTAKGKIKILENFLGEQVKELEPSAPAMIIGFETLPQVGEEFSAVEGEEAEGVKIVQKPVAATTDESLALRLIIKASDSGSLEALSAIIKATAEKKPIKIIAESVGDVGDNDVKLAISSGAVIIAFRSKTEKGPKFLAETNKIKIISSEIIYELIKAIDDFLLELEKPAPLGILKILAVFNQGNLQKQIVGGKVESGIFKNKAAFEIERDGNVVGAGRVANLQQQKKDATEVTEGKEAGLLINSETMLKSGDLLLIRK
ncbi:MAG: GTP-binding protein [Candidatus Liptonbacteria bacterium]|nr:GTP-binding protein [Candidatus Liptonbacteria bacterium]